MSDTDYYKYYDVECFAIFFKEGSDKYARMVLNKYGWDVHLNTDNYRNKKLLLNAILKEYLLYFETFPKIKKDFEQKYFKIDDKVVQTIMDGHDRIQK